ncbi:MAG: transporter [Oscillospiraceae bacterium]|nr:transporter [Oscillospiraceae bacterium]
MNLQYTLPEPERLAFEHNHPKVHIVYCIPFDIGEDGNWCGDGWIIASETNVFVMKNKQIVYETDIQNDGEFECLKMDGCGVLIQKNESQEKIIARFSMRHLSRFYYVSRGINLFAKNRTDVVESNEREKICPTCGRVLPGTSECPKCTGNGRFLKRIWLLMRPYKWKFLMISLLMLASSGISIYQAQFQRQFIDDVLIPKSGGIKEVLLFGVIMLLISVTGLLSTIIKNRWTTVLGSKISMNIREKLYSKIQALSLSFVDKRSAGELMNRITGDSIHIREFMEQVFSGLVSQIVTMVFVFIIMLIINWKLALLTLALIPVAAFISVSIKTRIRRIFRRQRRFDDISNNRLQDTLSGIRVVKSFGKEEMEIERFLKINKEFAEIQAFNEKFWATYFPLITFSVGAGVHLISYFGGLGVLSGTFTIGQLTQFSAYAGMLYAPISRMSFLPRMIARAVTSVERIYDVLDEESDIQLEESLVDLKISGDICFNGVTFGYHSYEPVLEEINLQVKQGEMIGIVGSSGAGKSTLINLIMRLYTPDSGDILIDGVNLKKINADSLYSQIGVVLQETFLFSGSIFENIRFSKPDATLEEIIQAAKIAGAHDFICKLPDGYNTYVGESGNTLSGGERQRIAIARAILGDPRILILDEATSSLDTETEYQIQEALGRLIKGRTTFAIAHRLSTLRNADRIMVIDNQQCAEIGTHEELLQKRGIYYHLVTAQLELKSKETKLTNKD